VILFRRGKILDKAHATSCGLANHESPKLRCVTAKFRTTALSCLVACREFIGQGGNVSRAFTTNAIW
jgi:hypothetical protein